MRTFYLLILATLAVCPPGGALEYVPHQICCLLEQGYAIEDVNARWGTVTLLAEPEDEFYLLLAPNATDMEILAAAMTFDEAVDIAEANYIIQSPEAIRQMVVAAVGGTWGDYQDQAMGERIGLPLAHLHSRGAGITVAVLDTGIDPDHQAFSGRLSDEGYDCVDRDHEPWEVANGVDDDRDGLVDEGFGHGTMVAGIVALIAPEAEIIPLRVLDDEGRGTIFDITKGIIHAAAHGAHVLNMSFGSPYEIINIARKLRVAHVHGALLIAGAGNRNQEFPPYHPAANSLTYMVTAVDSCDVKADFADFGDDVLVSAPGVGIRSAYPGGEWGLGSGCSFATPIVAGEVALLLSLAPELNDQEIAEHLAAGVDPIYHIPQNQPYVDLLGSGRVNLLAALGDLATADVSGYSDRAVAAWPNPSCGAVRLARPAAWDATHPVEIVIVDASGRMVRNLGTTRDLVWDGCSSSGSPVAPGLYWARLLSGGNSRTLPVTILR